MITALIYGDNHIRIIEKLLNQPHIKAEKKDNPEFSHLSNIEASCVVSAPGTGITDNIL
jgi:hypothetical protein